MPYKSTAQRGYFHWLESKGKLPKSIDLHEWDEASKGKELPQYAAMGGYIDGEEGEGDHKEGWEHWMHPLDTTGEPHTKEDEEEEKPEEYMSRGGFARMLKMRRRA